MFYIKLLVSLTALSIVASGSLYFLGNYPLTLIVTHGIVTLSVFCFCAGSAIIINALDRNNRHPVLWAMPFSFAVAFYVLLYVSNAVSNYFWKANININLAERMITHYYARYPVETSLVVTLIPLAIVFVLSIFFIRVFRSKSEELQGAARASFYYLSLSVFLAVQLVQYSIQSEQRDLSEYFAGEMVFDLFQEFTDSHQDYIADAGTIQDNVTQSTSYVPQVEKNININKKNIIVFVVDCLRADHLHQYGYPRDTAPFLTAEIEKNGGWWVKHAFSMCDESKCGIRSILTSHDFDTQNTQNAFNNTLHKKLRDNGYQINFLLTSDHAFGGLKRVYYPYDFYVDGVGFKNYPLNDDRGLISILEGWPAYNGSPNYFHFHLFSVHEAGVKYGKYLGKGVHGIKPGFLQPPSVAPRFPSSPELSRGKRVDSLDNKIFQMDLVFSRIHELLGNKGYLDNALIVITGDHGQGLGEHGYYGHISGLYNESLHIPLIIIDTSRERKLDIRELKFATQRDIAPTLLTALDIDVPESWEGIPLQVEKTQVAISTHRIPNRTDSYARIFYDPDTDSLYKYMFLSTFHGQKQQRLLYDLKKDPKEVDNLLESANNSGFAKGLVSKWGLDSLYSPGH